MAAQTIEDYRVKFDLKNTTEALERILTRHKYYQSVIDKLGVSKSETDDELACVSRIQYEGQHYCVYKPPRMKELETIDICLVCKKRKLGLTESSISVRSEAQTVSEQGSPPLLESLGPDRSQFKQNPSTRGNIYCYTGGLWVFAAKCEICKRDRYATWDDCKTKPFEKKDHEPVQ